MKTILYVEDHPPARLLMQAIIDELTPHRLVMAASGAEARRLVETAGETPSLYILDLDLPDTDGLVLARALGAHHPAPVILVSAYAEAIDEDDLTGVVHFYLAKPLDPDHVAETIQRALA